MSITVNEAFVEDFEALVYHLGQQEMSRLRNAVRNRTGTGNIFSFERLGKSDATASVSTSDGNANDLSTPINNVEHSRRGCAVKTWEWGELVQQEDLVRILIDPESEYLLSAAAAMGRTVDSILTTAMVDDQTTVNGGAGTALAATQFINGVTNTGTGGKLTLDVLREAKRKLDAAEVGIMQGGDRYAAIPAKGLQDLLEVTEVASADYNSVKALVQGEIDTYMGFKFIRTEILPTNANNAEIAVGDVGCLFWERSSMGLAIADDRFTRVGEDPSVKFSTRVYCQLTMGGARIEDEGVICNSILA
jgi:hypothetical protein